MGTQSTKALLLDESGTVRGRGSRSYRTSHPQPGWAEQDPRDWLAAVAGAVSDAAGSAGVAADSIAALGVAAQVDGIVPVDSANQPLGAAPIWMDRRAQAEVDVAALRIGPDRVRTLTGSNLDPSHGAPKIAWLRDHLPDPADGYLLPATFLVAALTGCRAIDRANASTLLLLDIATGEWSEELLAAFRINSQDLGDVRPATDVVGPVLGSVADAWRLPRCPVVVGTGDEHAACLAAGVMRPGVIADIVGTAEPIAAASDRPLNDAEGLVETHGHVPTDRWLVEHPGFVSAGSVRWLAEDVLGCSQLEIGRLAAEAPPGSGGVGFLPALGGAMTPRWAPEVLGAFTGLSIGHDRRHLARAVLEGCSYAVRDVVERLTALGLGGGAIRVVGGGARDETWLRIKADVTGRPIERLDEPEATALGAALTAAVGAGWWPDLDTASAATLRLVPGPEPDSANRAAYDDGWAAHRARFEALAPLETRSSSTGVHAADPA